MKGVFRSLSLQTKMAIFIWAANIILLLFSVSGIWDAVEINKQADRIAQINHCSEPLFLTLEALAFERGRTNVILAGENPINADNRIFVTERRNRVDQNLTVALERIKEINPLLIPPLKNQYAELQRLRAEVDIQTVLPLAARNPLLGDEWFARATAFIARIQDTLEILGKKDQPLDLFDFYHHFQLNCVEFRLFTGYSGSILTAAINKGAALTPEKYQEFIEARAKADHIWPDIENTISEFSTPELMQKRDQINRQYYGTYRPFQNELLRQALEGTASKESAQQLALLSVPAFDSIFELINVISAEKRHYVAQMNAKAVTGLRAALAEFILVVMFIVLTLGYFRIMLFAPLKRIIGSLKQIVNGQPIADLAEDASRRDEIGLLTQGVQLLQLSMQEERRLKELNEALAITDKLTGLYNRQMLDQTLVRVTAQADRYEEAISMVLFDLDRFKRVNDTWGHPVGDEVLKRTAQTVRELVRTSDLFFRFGGEEFLILMPQTDLAGAVNAAEKIRAALEKVDHPLAGQVTVSLGVAERKRDETFDDWYKRTDEALYQAKSCGRNRIACSSPETTPVASVHMVWQPEWTSGHSEIDAQHQELLSKADAFFGLSLLPDADPAQTQPLLEKLLAEIAGHFSSEEHILTQIGYPEADKHKLIHWQLLSRAVKLKADYINGTLQASAFISFIIDDVVLGDMLKDDALFFPYTKKNPEK